MAEIDHLSPTKLGTWLTCGMRAYYSYVCGIKVPPSGALFRGSRCHEATAWGYVQKVETGRDAREKDIVDYYVARFDERMKEEEILWEDEQPTAVRDRGIEGVRIYRRSRMLGVQPATVEGRAFVEQCIEVPGEALDLIQPRRDGRVWDKSLIVIPDLVALDGTQKNGGPKRVVVADVKFRARGATDFEARQSIQLAAGHLAVSALEDFAPSDVVLDTVKILKTKAEIEPQREPFGRERHVAFLRVAEDVTRAWEADIFPPRTGGWWCSPRYCGYWDRCPYGGGERTVYNAPAAKVAG